MQSRIHFLGVLLLAVTGFQLALCEDAITVSGIIDEAATLDCDLPKSDPPNVVWSDLVWNEVRGAVQIYSNADGINPNHKHADNYEIDPESFSLTMKKISVNDAGEIFCESVVDGETQKKTFKLSTTEAPMCEGTSVLTNGQNTKLTCKAAYSGEIPTLQWKKGTEALVQMDEYDIELAQVSASFDATPAHDQEEMICSMEHLGKMASCKIKLDVKYAVQDLKIEPLANEVRVKQKITCSASGNPTPKITLNPGNKQGEGSASILVGKDWLGTVQEVSCTASNTYQGQVQIDSINSTYEVLVPKQGTEPTPTEIKTTPEVIQTTANVNKTTSQVDEVVKDVVNSTALPLEPTEKPNTPNPKPDNSKGEPEQPGPSTGAAGLPLGLIVGIIIGVVVILVIIIAVICVKRKQAAKKQGHKPIPQNDNGDMRNDSKA